MATLNTNPLGNPSQGIVSTINKATGLAQPTVKPTSIVGDGQIGPLAPKTTPLALGVKAKSPQQNVAPTAKTIPASQTIPSSTQNNLDLTGYTNTMVSQGLNTNGTPISSNTKQPTNTINTDTNSGYNTPLANAVGGLAGANIKNQQLGENAQDIASKAGSKIEDIGKNAAQTEGEYTTGMIAPRAQGLAQTVAQTAAAQQAAVSQGAQTALTGNAQALTGQAQTQAAQQAAGSLSLPGSQYGQLTSNITGTPISGGGVTNNPQLNTAVQTAMQLVHNGASPQDPSVQSLLSPFGYAGQQAFTNAQQQTTGGTYNPTAQSAVANSNATQGVNYKQQSVDLSTSLQQLDSASTLAQNFLSSNNLLNPTQNPNVNAGINTYIGNITNPAAKLQYNAIIGDISKFTSSILASNSGQIPTAVTNTLQSFDPSTLSAAQLGPYLKTLQDLGNNQLNVLQNQTQQLIPNSNTNTYTGPETTQSTTTATAPIAPGPQIKSTTGQALAGTAMNVIGGIERIFSGLAGKLFGIL